MLSAGRARTATTPSRVVGSSWRQDLTLGGETGRWRNDSTLGGTPMQAHRAATNQHTNDDLDTLAGWVNTYAGPNSPDRIPEVNGPTWPLRTRQFRRTLAWFIASRPGGSIVSAPID
uniref:Uncharacterized protein n=1 Tax=uncultured bacterium esnapd14 TaxID=1366594 RepID=S5UCR9_9BACT|nr:hypothetical protein [uncultured bacterium esnapd14]